MDMKLLSKMFHNEDALFCRVWCVSWNPSGSILASCGADKTIKIWSFEDDKLKLVEQLIGDQHRAIRSLSFSPCGKFLASASFDGTIIIYEKESNGFCELHKLEGHESEVKCCQYSPSGRFIATCSRDKSIWIWQVDEDDDLEVLSILQSHSGDVKCVKWHPTDDILISASYDNSIKVYTYDGEDFVTAQTIQNAHTTTVWCIDFDSEGSFFISAGGDGKIKVYKKINASKLSEVTFEEIVDFAIPNCKWPLYTLSWNKFNNYIAVGGGDKKVRILCFENNLLSIVNEYRMDDEINTLSWSPTNGNLLAIGLDNGEVNILEVKF